MMSPKTTSAVFLDRDGTIIEDVGCVRDTSQVVFFSNTVRALQLLADRHRLFIVTNQAGVSEGTVSDAAVNEVHEFIVSYLNRFGIVIEQVYYCPHKRTDGCRCIKPNMLFLDEAASHHGVDLRRSFVVGDHPHDMELAMNAGARGIYVLTGHGEKHRAELSASCHVAKDIEHAATMINQELQYE